MKNIPIMKPYFDSKELKEIEEVLNTGWVAQGPKVQEFEEAVAKHEGIAQAIATTSCTTALHLALVAMGVQSKHDVLLPSFTFIATANAVEYTGATPVLVDVDTATYNIDVSFLEKYIKEHYTKKNSVMVNKETQKELFGIIAVNLFGLCADIPAVNKLAAEYNIQVLEDSACALGATIDGKHQGSFGNTACLSFHPRKSITTGEGGMILTDDLLIADKTRKLRSHGASISEVARSLAKGFMLPDFDELGYNYRMNDIQAAVGVAQMDKFDRMLVSKVKGASNYEKLLAGNKYLITPAVPARYGHTYQSYVCMLDNDGMGLSVDEAHDVRNEVMEILENNGVATRQGTHAVHTLGYYVSKYGYKSADLPGSYKCDKLSIALPLYFEICDEEQQEVVQILTDSFDKIMSKKEK